MTGAGYCWECHHEHTGEDQTCDQARDARVTSHANAARLAIAEARETCCSHGIPPNVCRQHETKETA